MKIIQSLVVGISMYSRIPMPKIEWNEDNMKYALCFFPLIGVIIGGEIYGIGRLLFSIESGGLLRGAVFTLFPILLTGGIHMDGFMDTMDAISSWGDREKRLAILKDSHTGAFAVLGMGCYLVWSVAVWSEVHLEMLGTLSGIFVISRAFSGFSVVTFPSARENGLARTFQDSAQKKVVQVAMSGYLILAACVMAWQNGSLAVAAILAGILTFVYYRHMALKTFGGITGDLAGYFLELAELFMVTAVVFAGGWIWN